MLQSKMRWDLLDQRHSKREKIQELSTSLNLTPLVASLLFNRGITTVDDANQFIHIHEQPFQDPFLLDGMEEAVKRIKDAIHRNEPIMIYGDYDADGVCSTTIILSALKKLGANVDFYIPNRFLEGYGPNEEAFKKIHQQGYQLIITVDTGIAAIKEAKLAKELNMDLIITDHHEIGPELPEALAIIHPKKGGSHYPFKDLAGCGVAFKLACALLNEVPEELIEIAAIGTIADLVPLYDENRLIVRKGIDQLRKSSRPGIQALLKVAGMNASQIDEEAIGFALAPRINAVGRLQSAVPAVHLLLTEDENEATLLADKIDELNKERQLLVNQMTKEAIEEIEAHYPIKDNPVIVVAKENWNSGVVGIVASKLVEKYYRPAIVLSIDPETRLAKGSARSIEGFDLYENLSQSRDILPHFGGHPMAAGMTLEEKDIPELRKRLIQLANEQLTENDFIPIKKVDVTCKLQDITVEAIEQLQLLSPFGVSNPKPVFLLENVHFSNMKRIGADGSHLKMILENDQHEVDTIGFGFGDIIDEISPLSKVSVVGDLMINEWNGRRKPQLKIQDIAVDDWQLFDYRGKPIEQILKKLPNEKLVFILFNESSRQYVLNYDKVWVIKEGNQLDKLDLNHQYVVLLDMPKSEGVIDLLFEKGKPERIYAIFHQHAEHFFSTVPTREHFKWFYAFLMKKGPFNLNKYGEELAKQRGWTKEIIYFMTKVFFELEFVTIEDGVISLNRSIKKRDLTESKTYQEKQKQIKLEQLFLYSTNQQLKSWFDSKINHSKNEQQVILINE